MRVFEELTPECDKTAQLFAVGLEQKEIAEVKFRAIATIKKQIYTAMDILKVRNGRELSIKYAERITGKIIEKGRLVLSILLLCCFIGGFQSNYAPRSQRRGHRVIRTISRRQEIVSVMLN